jgi:SP family general alpha glucoside:H+ symporter-like MFS transporter
VQEKQVGVMEAIRKYPREIFWTIIFALGLVMAGYDAQIISSLYVNNPFTPQQLIIS